MCRQIVTNTWLQLQELQNIVNDPDIVVVSGDKVCSLMNPKDCFKRPQNMINEGIQNGVNIILIINIENYCCLAFI